METKYITICDAVSERIKQLLKERQMSVYKLADVSDVIYNTLKAVVAKKNSSVDFGIVAKVAGGFDMTIAEFVDSPLFDEDNLKL